MTNITQQNFSIIAAQDHAQVALAIPGSRLFDINQSNNQIGPTDNTFSYCTDPTFADSRYKLNQGERGQLVQFRATLNGQLVPAYCLEESLIGPLENQVYQSQPPSVILAGETQSTQLGISWLLANGYPIASGAETFALAGVSFTGMNDADAYAAVQIAIWRLRGMITVDESRLMDCGNPEITSPKSARINEVVNGLLQLAREFGDAASSTTDQGPATMPLCGVFSHSCPIQCCNTNEIPSNPAEPYISFQGCPYDMRFACGRLLVGPFVMQSNISGTATVSISQQCADNDRFHIQFADFCGNPIAAPAVGQEFYLSILSTSRSFCIELNASITTTVVQINYLEYVEPEPRLQNIGAAIRGEPFTAATGTTVCIQVPAELLHNIKHNLSNTSCTNKEGGSGSVNINNNNNNLLAAMNMLNMGFGWPWHPSHPQPPGPWPPRPQPPGPWPPGPQPPGPWPPGPQPPGPWPPGPQPPGPWPPGPWPPGPQPPGPWPPGPQPPGPWPPGPWPPKPQPPGPWPPRPWPPKPQPPGSSRPCSPCLIPPSCTPHCCCKNSGNGGRRDSGYHQ